MTPPVLIKGLDQIPNEGLHRLKRKIAKGDKILMTGQITSGGSDYG